MFDLVYELIVTAFGWCRSYHMLQTKEKEIVHCDGALDHISSIETNELSVLLSSEFELGKSSLDNITNTHVSTDDIRLSHRALVYAVCTRAVT